MIHGRMGRGSVKSEASVITQMVTSTWHPGKSGVRPKVKAGDWELSAFTCQDIVMRNFTYKCANEVMSNDTSLIIPTLKRM